MARRPEIQALRALAVALVVVHHLWPSALPGGFVGVDVFFVISGFLITSLLVQDESLSLRRFWARRARRILPAALVTLLVCAVATVVFVPLALWSQFLAEMRASTLYVQNWQLAADAGDYFTRAANARSPVLHFWSLSVEEQFYLVWPVLIVLAAPRRWALFAVVVTVTAVSFAYSLYATVTDPAAAYFVTPSRAWELGAGGLLAVCGGRPRASRALCAAGMAAIAVAALRFSPATPFPGVAALLPVLGAVAAIRAGLASRGLAARPIQVLGDHSYSIYLWHWPVLALAPFVASGEPRIALLAATLALAWLSKRLVEDPVRSARRAPAWAFCAATTAVLAVVAAAAFHVDDELRIARHASRAVLEAPPRCFGAPARDPERPCRDARLRLMVVPTPLEAHELRNPPCPVIERHGPLQVCTFGASHGPLVALLGDSHASHWRAALAVVARTEGWRGRSMTHTGCPLSTGPAGLPKPDGPECERWRERVFAWFGRHPDVHTAFVSALSGRAGRFGTKVDGALGAWRRLPATVERIVVLRDTPKMLGDTDVCVERAIARHRPAGPACARPRRAAVDRDAQQVAAAQAGAVRVRVVDLNDFICSRRRCLPVVGGALVFKDNNHMTAVFTRTLGPYLKQAIDRQRVQIGA